MEKFAVDLDKVLDEFELNEDRAHELTAGQEEKPSGYREFLLASRENAYSYNECMVPLPEPEPESTRLDASSTTVSLRYDIPFEPAEKINLMEADFSAAPRKTSSVQDENLSSPGKVTVPINTREATTKISLTKTVNENDGSCKPRTARRSSLDGGAHGEGIVSNGGISHASDVANGDVLQHMEREQAECSADRLMKDIESAMGTGLSLPAHDQGNSLDSTNHCSELKTDLNDSLAPRPDYTMEASSTNAMLSVGVPVQQNEVPFYDGTDRGETVSQLPCAGAENNSESHSFVATCHNVKLSSVTSSNNLNNSFGGSDAELSSIDYITSLLRQSTPLSPEEIEEKPATKIETSKDSKACTPFETPVESPDEMDTVANVGHNPVVSVGFSEQTNVSDAELEKYLKEAEDNEKLTSIKSHVASVGANNDGNLNVASEHDVDGLSSGDEFYSPLMERSDLPHEHVVHNELRPDQTYEEALLNVKKVEKKAMNVEPPSVTENDVCPSSSVVHNKMVAMESQSTLSVCSTNTGTRPKSSSDVDGNLSLGVDGEKFSKEPQDAWLDRRILHDAINRERAQRTKSSKVHMVKEQQNLEIKNQLHMGTHNKNMVTVDGSGLKDVQVFDPQVEQDCRSPHPDRERVGLVTEPCILPNAVCNDEVVTVAHDDDEDDEMCVSADEQSSRNVMSDGSRRQRPTSLNLSGRLEVETDDASGIDNPSKVEYSEAEEALLLDESTIVNDRTAADQLLPEQSQILDDGTAATTAWTDMEAQVGKVAPFWIPDADAPACMQCSIKFTVIKRRHHCRACGRVLCGQCCAWKAKLQYMDNKEARVCHQCLQSLRKVQAVEQWPPTMASPITSPLASPSPLTSVPTHSPNPNNPNEYCSTVPPLQQVRTGASAPPTVMVPVGVLKREGTKTRGEPKQVMFSDGIRPGGDLTELDSPVDLKPPYRRQKRMQKRIEKIGDNEPFFENLERAKIHAGTMQPSLPHDLISNNHVDHFPRVMVGLHSFREYLFEENPDTEELFVHLQDKQAPPVMFAVNKNLFVHVKIITLDCCIKKTCWCFSTEGMGTVGQDELLVILECLPDEKIVPEDMFSHFNSIYEDASQGNLIVDLGHTIFTQSFLGSREHGGFLYIRPTFQCLNLLPLPPQPYLVGILLQKWETPWAKVFPIRLMLRLGSEFRFYPCPLVSVRFRKPVYAEIGHTIMNLLADFRNYQYKLPVVQGMVIHMEEKITHVNIPRNRYEEAMKALNNSNDHVLALGGNFSVEADSHLVCIQNDEGNYQTQAINIENKPRKVTGASFVVFNGALKSSSGLSAKSSIVEDGLMVQIPPDTMTALRQALREMRDFPVKCGPLTAELPEEEVVVCWVDDDKRINIGVKSPIDGMSMEGISSLHIHGGTDYVDQRLLIRWTEVFFLHADEGTSGRRSEPINTSRLAEILAQACCMALTMHVKSLKEANLTKIGLRVTIDSENVGYEIGAQETKLPAEYMNDLDSELVPVIHRAASQTEDTSVTLELIFHIMEQ